MKDLLCEIDSIKKDQKLIDSKESFNEDSSSLFLEGGCRKTMSSPEAKTRFQKNKSLNIKANVEYASKLNEYKGIFHSLCKELTSVINEKMVVDQENTRLLKELELKSTEVSRLSLNSPKTSSQSIFIT